MGGVVVKTPRWFREEPPEEAEALEALASDRAARFKALSRSSVVLAVRPLWVRWEEARALFGLPRAVLAELALAGKVAAKKVKGGKGGAVIFEVAGIERAVSALPDWGGGALGATRPTTAASGRRGSESKEGGK